MRVADPGSGVTRVKFGMPSTAPNHLDLGGGGGATLIFWHLEIKKSLQKQCG